MLTCPTFFLTRIFNFEGENEFYDKVALLGDQWRVSSQRAWRATRRPHPHLTPTMISNTSYIHVLMLTSLCWPLLPLHSYWLLLQKLDNRIVEWCYGGGEVGGRNEFWWGGQGPYWLLCVPYNSAVDPLTPPTPPKGIPGMNGPLATQENGMLATSHTLSHTCEIARVDYCSLHTHTHGMCLVKYISLQHLHHRVQAHNSYTYPPPAHNNSY